MLPLKCKLKQVQTPGINSQNNYKRKKQHSGGLESFSIFELRHQSHIIIVRETKKNAVIVV